MRYSQIRNLDIANGPGCRVSIFVSGCEHRCKNCFNPETWNFNHGTEFTEDTLNSVLKLAVPSHISGLSILGGEPAHPRNIADVCRLARRFKEKYPDKTVWLWTGYLLEDVFEDLVDSGIDVIVDGKFVEELTDSDYAYAGSTNQRIIRLREA